MSVDSVILVYGDGYYRSESNSVCNQTRDQTNQTIAKRELDMPGLITSKR